ncbi:MAG: ABC transporter ATP-binding protein [Sphaerochaetaceae bacterium]|nr:ABC transporter ATP-binding protein [Sphaerochaetaceae bacterium]
MNEKVLEVKKLRTNFYSNNKCNKVLNGISFETFAGQTLCIVGESGCGKSVTASSIMQLLPDLGRIESGEIIFHDNGKSIRLDKMSRNGREINSIRGKRIAMVFQDPMTALNPVYKIGNQIAENLLQHTTMTKKEAHDKAVQLLREMDIPNPRKRAEEYPHQFSGGMRQRAMIAMAMSCEPKLLIADEPTTALDVTIQAQIFLLMDKLKKEHGTSIMMITHDMGVVAEMADTVIVMYMGYIVERGTAKEIFSNPSHPYTRALLASIPVVGKGKNQDLQPIRGVTADPYNRPKGCQFAPRCDYCTPVCEKMIPSEVNLYGTHCVSCFHRHVEVQK